MLVESKRSLRATRWVARLPRLALASACFVLIVAGIGSIVRVTPEPHARTTAPQARDVGVEALAEEFARDYLNWSVDAPSASTNSSGVDAPAVPKPVRQRVRWTTIAATQRSGRTWIVTVSANTTRGAYDLAVPIERDRRGLLTIAGDPALVGSIPTARRRIPYANERDVDDAALDTVVERALRNYLAGDRRDLVADLTIDAIVVLPNVHLKLLAVDRITWTQTPHRAAAAVRVRTPDGLELNLRYELALARRAGRWLVRAVHTNPMPEVHP